MSLPIPHQQARSVRAAAPPRRVLTSVDVVPAVPVLPEPWPRRCVELVAVVVAVLALLPVLVTLALLVRLTSRGPVLFRQVRIGAGGRAITVWKFRSMVADAEARRAELEDRNERVDGPLFKIREDPRVTSVGRWMRRFSLDELPQLFNVLGGSMSLVGPRPALPHEAASFEPRAAHRHAVRPGLTGLAQVSGRSDLPWPEALELDLAYVADRSLRLDLAIVWRTLPAVLSARGAY